MRIARHLDCFCPLGRGDDEKDQQKHADRCQDPDQGIVEGSAQGRVDLIWADNAGCIRRQRGDEEQAEGPQQDSAGTILITGPR